MVLLGVGLGSFSMILALIGLRGRTPESVSALSTVTQGWGYAAAGVGPLLVGVLREATGGFTGMFVLLLVGVGLLVLTGWQVCRERYVDDEEHGLGGRGGPPGSEGTEVAGAETPVEVPPGR